MKNQTGSAVISEYNSEYLVNGKKARETATVIDKKGKKTAKTAAYAYDLLGRITKETQTGREDISYTYDNNNNQKQMKVGNKITAYKYNKNDELLRTDTLNTDTEKDKVVIYKNDKNGNQLATVNRYEIPSDKKDNTYVDIDVTLGDNRLNENVVNHYNALNQLTQTLTKNYKVSFTYDAGGLRTSKTVNGERTVFVWDGDQVVMELTKNGKVKKRYIRGNDLIFADKGTENASGEASGKQYYVTDPHGNVVQLTDESGKVIKIYEYDSFGNEIKPDSKDDNPFRYCGEYYDKETEEVYLRARYYQPEMGRFLTRDTYTGEADEPLSLHLYVYCENDGVNMVDPSGHRRYATEQELAGMSLKLQEYYTAILKQKGTKKGDGKNKLNFSKLKPSNKIKKIIKQYEGYYNYMYDSASPQDKELRKRYNANDGRDWTIGWGHKIYGKEGKKYMNSNIDKEQAKIYFKNDLKKVTNGTLKNYLKKYKIKLYQYQYDALVCFTYNLGYNFWDKEKNSNQTIFRLIKSKDYSDKKKVESVFCLYKNPNLLKRRKKEAKIFNTGKYPAN